jgi:hypothetical protein
MPVNRFQVFSVEIALWALYQANFQKPIRHVGRLGGLKRLIAG